MSRFWCFDTSLTSWHHDCSRDTSGEDYSPMIPLQPHPQGLGYITTQPICCTPCLDPLPRCFDLGYHRAHRVVHEHRFDVWCQLRVWCQWCFNTLTPWHLVSQSLYRIWILYRWSAGWLLLLMMQKILYLDLVSAVFDVAIHQDLFCILLWHLSGLMSATSAAGARAWFHSFWRSNIDKWTIVSASWTSLAFKPHFFIAAPLRTVLSAFWFADFDGLWATLLCCHLATALSLHCISLRNVMLRLLLLFCLFPLEWEMNR